ncbi:MAG: hypothetical protein WCG87_07420 [Bacteroidota bacterium]
MSTLIRRYTEPLEADELIFLKDKEQKDRKQYYKAFRILMVVCFVLPFIGSWYRVTEDAENAFSMSRFFTSVTALLFLSIGAVWTAYRFNLRKIQWDIKSQTKTIERTHITRKQYMPRNHVYFFYIDSDTRISIEVNENDYHQFETGDEVNIEYTTHAKLFLGYF